VAVIHSEPKSEHLGIVTAEMGLSGQSMLSGACEDTSIWNLGGVGLEFSNAKRRQQPDGIINADGIQPPVGITEQFTDRMLQEKHTIVVFGKPFKLNTAAIAATSM